ncbi:MAG: hypothetical protein JW982_04955 [Spirochaetes bacterium]|nr:hypothetical protein [Spirochaetota bacterium]
MFVRKTKLSSLIKKERTKERKLCKEQFSRDIKTCLSELKEDYEQKIKILKKDFNDELRKKDKEISVLKSEIANNHRDYQNLRQRETDLDNMSAELEQIIETMNIKIQESMQPFYRTRAILAGTKRKSDKKHSKVETIFRAVQ